MLADLLSERFAADFKECWERDRTATPVRAFAVRLHATDCSLRETEEILHLLGVERSHQSIWQWVHLLADSVPDPPCAQPTRVAVDETAVRINGELSWLYAAIDPDSKLLLGVDHFERHGTDPATEFPRQLTEKHDLSDTEFLVDGYGYLTALFRLDEQSSGVRQPKPHRKVVSHSQNESRPLPQLVGRQSGCRCPVACTVRVLL